MKEYEWKTDVVIALPEGVNPDVVHEAIWDAVVAVVEAHGGQMGGGDKFRPWTPEEEGDGSDED